MDLLYDTFSPAYVMLMFGFFLKLKTRVRERDVLNVALAFILLTLSKFMRWHIFGYFMFFEAKNILCFSRKILKYFCLFLTEDRIPGEVLVLASKFINKRMIKQNWGFLYLILFLFLFLSRLLLSPCSAYAKCFY